MNDYKIPKAINTWAEEDRPREKMLLKGNLALSNSELIAILMGSGNREQSAVELAQNILASVDNDLNKLAKLSIKDLTKFKGVGDAKAISIVAALELGRRRKTSDKEEKVKINHALDCYNVLKPFMLDLVREEFYIILLDRNNNIIKISQISAGSISGTVVDSRIVFKTALDHLASGIVLAHNHPSGNLKPSNQDITLTKKMQEAGRFLDVTVMDHLIFTNDGYFSFSENDLME